MLAHIVNALHSENHAAAADYAGLAMMAVDQAAKDGGKWDVAWTMSLFQDPPAQIFAPLPACATSSPFTALADTAMSVVALAYLREIDTMTTRRAELNPPGQRQRPPGRVLPNSPPASEAPGADPGAAGYQRRQPRGKAKAKAAAGA